MTDEIEKLRKALDRVASPRAFYVATSNIDPEAAGRMWFAKYVLDGLSLDEAEAAAAGQAFAVGTNRRRL